MADRSTFHWLVRLAIVAVLVAPVFVPWLGVAESWVESVALPGVGSVPVFRVVGFTLAVFVLGWGVWQKRRKRGQPGEDRRIDGTGEEYFRYAYNNQTDAAKEGDRIQSEADRLAEADRRAGRRP